MKDVEISSDAKNGTLNKLKRHILRLEGKIGRQKRA